MYSSYLRTHRQLVTCGRFLATAISGVLVAGLFTGCSQKGESTSLAAFESQSSQASFPPKAAPCIKASDQFLHDVSAGNLIAAKTMLRGIQEDPLGLVASLVKTHGAITGITYSSFDPAYDYDLVHIYGTASYADRTSRPFEITLSNIPDGKGNYTNTYSIFSFYDINSGKMRP